LVSFVRASEGDSSRVKECLPFVCPSVEQIERMIGSSEAIVILAENREAIVGAVGGWLKGTPSGYDDEDEALRQHGAYNEAHLCWIAVKEEHREKKIGSTLLERVCNWARKNGKEKIWVEAQPNTSDFDSVAFYRRSGFKEIARFQDEKGEEYVTMLKRL
jgi:ribosomal protein S18 acetylase RimI-like enzyme